MSDTFESVHDAICRFEELLIDNELGADHAYDLVMNSPEDQKSLQWTIERLRADVHEAYRVFNEWHDLERKENGLGVPPVAGGAA
ncbi:MAG: hypothetical protein J0G95_02125 [Rhizobiales bacterium]|nr:hypothetical protein [Hyphomicrobiales bacterium]